MAYPNSTYQPYLSVLNWTDLAGSVRLRLAVVLAALGMIGCNRNYYYDPANLPPELEVAPTENPQTVDLSKLSGDTASSELIDRGDVLEVTIVAGLASEDTTTFPVRVGDDGSANLPVIGKIPLAGLELEGAEQAIAAACVTSALFRKPHVTVTMKRQRVNRVTVIGAVNEPGVYSLPRGASYMLNALVAAGGLAEDAGAHVEVRHPRVRSPGNANGVVLAFKDGDVPSDAHLTELDAAQSKSVKINLIAAAREGTGGVYTDDGSVVMVERRAPRPVQVMGLVREPGRFEIPLGQDLYVLDAISLAGGRSDKWADKVLVIRRIPGRAEPAVIRLSLRKAKLKGTGNLRLVPGDVVSVETTPTSLLFEFLRAFRPGVGASLGVL